MIFYHVDVFSSEILSGNGLTVIFHEEDMNMQYMQAIAQEFKQFETIFLKQTGEKRFRARIFTMEEELDFAGHPILGAMAAIHEKLYAEVQNVTAFFELNNKTLQAESVKMESYFQATMNQGAPGFLGTVEGELVNLFLHALNLTTDHLHPTLRTVFEVIFFRITDFRNLITYYFYYLINIFNVYYKFTNYIIL